MKSTVVKLVAALTLGLVAAPLTAESQQAGKVYRIGFLTWGSRGGHRSTCFRRSSKRSESVAG